MDKEFSEYIYLDNNGNIMYTSRNVPMKYEDQTDCIVIHCNSEYDLDRLLDILVPRVENHDDYCDEQYWITRKDDDYCDERVAI